MGVEAYPLLNHKPALMRAYKVTISKKGGGDGDDWVEKKEFKKLLANLFYFNKIFWVYDQVDNDKDRRLNLQEFKQCLALCGAGMSNAQAQQEFRKVDKNGGGIILFDEFCRYFTESKCPQSNDRAYRLSLLVSVLPLCQFTSQVLQLHAEMRGRG